MKSTSFAEGGYRHALTLIIPLVLSNSAFTVMQFTDRILLARYSSEAIQAAMPAGCLSFTLISFFASVAGYAGTFVAQYHGSGNFRACVRSCVAGLFLAAALLPLCLLLIPLCGWMVAVAGHAPALQELENQYTFWMLVGGPLEAARWVLGGYLVGRNRVVANTVVTFIGCGLNIVLDFALIFGLWGFPEWGLRGAAVATFASGAVSTLLLLGVVFAGRDVRGVPPRERLCPDWGIVRRIVRFGTPSGIQMLFDNGAFTFFVLLTGRLDPLSLATSNIAYAINGLAIAPLFGFGNAASTLVGQFQGAGRSDLAKASCWRCLHLGWIYMAVLAVVFLALPETLLSAFRSENAPYTVAEMVGLGRKLLVLLAVWGMFDTMNVMFISALKGAGDTVFVMALLIAGGWLAWIPAELLTLNVFHGGILDAWIVQCVYICLLALVFLWRWQRGKWMSINVIEKTGA